jgi:chloramphenicol 3-O-phosphotransferase
VVPADDIVRFGDPVDDGWEWWNIPSVDERVVGCPRAGRRALQLLDGMYRSAVAMTRAGNNVVLEDVVWEPAVAAIARDALGSIDPLVVKLVCPHDVAVGRERARADRFDGGVAAYNSEPELITDADVTIDSSLLAREAIAERILRALDAKTAGRTPQTDR